MSTAVSSATAPGAARPQAGRGQGWLLVLAGLSLAPALVLTFLRLVPPTDDATALLASFIPYGLLGYAVALALLLVALLRSRRRRRLGLVVVGVLALTALQVSWQVPFFVSDHRPAVGRPFTLLTLNTLTGTADPDSLMSAAATADVVVLVEITPEGVAALNLRGWDREFPHVAGDLGPGASGTAVFSRFPLSGTTQIRGTEYGQWLTTVAVPGLGAVRLLAAHPCNPYCAPGRWTAEHALLASALRAQGPGPLVAAGDFNAVDDHGPMLTLGRQGLTSATDVLGAGWLPTYPANSRVPPLLAIDHVLLNAGMTATSLRTVDVAGSDHLGLLATLARTG